MHGFRKRRFFVEVHKSIRKKYFVALKPIEKFPNWLFCHFLPLITILHPSSIGIKVIFSENSAPLHRETLLFPASSIHLSSTNLLILLEPNLKYKYEKTN